MLPRHLIPLAMGLAAFVVAEAASEITHDALPHAVACVAGRVTIVTAPDGAGSCRYATFADRGEAELFAHDRFGSLGAPCGCD